MLKQVTFTPLALKPSRTLKFRIITSLVVASFSLIALVSVAQTVQLAQVTQITSSSSVSFQAADANPVASARAAASVAAQIDVDANSSETERSTVEGSVGGGSVSNSYSSEPTVPSEAAVPEVAKNARVDAEGGHELNPSLISSKFILGKEVKPNTSVRLTWNPEAAAGGFSEQTPVLVVNGKEPGKTLCLTGAVHGDELNGIEMIRRVIFDIKPEKLTGTIIGVPVANIMGFRRNSRYLPDRRDWNRYFPGNTHGSSASRLAHSFFTSIILHCDALVDIHTGSFHRTNLPQLRADLANEQVARLAQNFGSIAVLNSHGNYNSLRAAAVRAGIPTVTLEAGEPMAMQREVVDEGVAAINTLLAKIGMYGKQKSWGRIAPVYYRSTWVRANQSGILFSNATLGKRVKAGEVLGTVTDPITNGRSKIVSPYRGRVLGMALDQVVLPGFAAYHIGIQTPEAILIEESQLNEGPVEEDEEDGDDAGDPADEELEPETGVSQAQDRMVDE